MGNKHRGVRQAQDLGLVGWLQTRGKGRWLGGTGEGSISVLSHTMRMMYRQGSDSRDSVPIFVHKILNFGKR